MVQEQSAEEGLDASEIGNAVFDVMHLDLSLCSRDDSVSATVEQSDLRAAVIYGCRVAAHIQFVDSEYVTQTYDGSQSDELVQTT